MRSTIGRSVGTAPAPNRVTDQRVALALLSLIPPDLGGPSAPIFEPPRNGIIGPQLQAAIYNFQRRYNPARFQDGRIDPGGRTLRQLNELMRNRSWQKSDLSIRSGNTNTIILPPVLPPINFGQTEEILTQPDTMACWATVTTKIKLWTDDVIDLDYYSLTTPDEKIKHMLSKLKRKDYYKRLYETNAGLPPKDNPDLFINELNGREVKIYGSPVIVNWGFAPEFIRILATKFGWHTLFSKTSKPIIVNTARMINGEPSPHLIMLTGFEDIYTSKKFDHYDAYLDMGGTVTYENTHPGEIKKMSISDLDFYLSYIPEGSDNLNKRTRCWLY